MTNLLTGNMPPYTHWTGGWAHPRASVNTSEQTPLVFVTKHAIIPQLTSQQPSHCINYATTAPRQEWHQLILQNQLFIRIWNTNAQILETSLQVIQRNHQKPLHIKKKMLYHCLTIHALKTYGMTSNIVCYWQAMCDQYLPIFSNAITSWHKTEMLLISIYSTYNI